ncbi:alkylated DNA repair protein ALKBH8 homolog [Cannabis sativa]|uniref:alkylated DNA repair protein ALKBH8 homolog n=1 Tax=Cannabis sativa TaxID=3483 RepID=UPI0029C9DB92|nr:alkylated DNA repair protein ALKBH8 homolog [Cannabis sativa]XP_060975006.1 alkylated DNA repair protein ALKBH8 homolog [Cannabis sativa]
MGPSPPKPSRFTRPKVGESQSSPNLYVANCGPAVGLSYDTIASVFRTFGEVKAVNPADGSGVRVIVSYAEEGSARNALESLHARPCLQLGGRFLHIQYSFLQTLSLVNDPLPVALMASELNIPGLHLLHDFVSLEEERDLIAAVDEMPWNNLSKRRVQHYGYEFCYETRNINAKKKLGELPSFVFPVLKKQSMFAKYGIPADVILDQLTVNEYPPGVGLSPHIDTHSAFEGLILSLSLAGPCIMEFRRYEDGDWNSKASLGFDMENSKTDSNFVRRAIHLPPRSMLMLFGEARYAWHHYIPHHKIDMVNDEVIRRGARRVSFTFRKVRTNPCNCDFPHHCDSQRDRTR